MLLAFGCFALSIVAAAAANINGDAAVATALAAAAGGETIRAGVSLPDAVAFLVEL